MHTRVSSMLKEQHYTGSLDRDRSRRPQRTGYNSFDSSWYPEDTRFWSSFSQLM